MSYFDGFMFLFLILCVLWMHQKTFNQSAKTIQTLSDVSDKYFSQILNLQERLYEAHKFEEFLKEILDEMKKSRG